MGHIQRYVYWLGHDADGSLPPVDVVAGVLGPAARAQYACAIALGPDEELVFTPPQWIGDWETGRPLAPAYQYIWRAPRVRLVAPVAPPRGPYRPATLPPSACGLGSDPPRSARRRSSRVDAGPAATSAPSERIASQ